MLDSPIPVTLSKTEFHNAVQANRAERFNVGKQTLKVIDLQPIFMGWLSKSEERMDVFYRMALEFYFSDSAGNQVSPARSTDVQRKNEKMMGSAKVRPLGG